MSEQPKLSVLQRVLLTITREEDEEKLLEIYDSMHLPICFQGRGQGTAPSELLDIFGLRGTGRLLTACILPKFMVPSALEAVRRGEAPDLTVGQKHTRECYGVAAEGADKTRIERDIKTMPNYFADYDTTVHFISQEELDRDHSGIPHGGFVIRTGTTGAHTKQMIEYSLKLGSNPEFTSSVIAAYARAAYKMAQEGITGAKTVFDVAPAYLSALDGAELRKHLL